MRIKFGRSWHLLLADFSIFNFTADIELTIIVSWEVALLVVALRLVGLLVVALWVRVSEREAEVSLIWVGNTITVIIWVTLKICQRS